MTRRSTVALLLALVCAAPAPAADSASHLRIALSSSPNSLNPLIGTQAIESFTGELVFDGLVASYPNGTMLPDLASVVPTQANGGISRDGRTITYHLRRNVRWHDGAPFTSRDVAFTQRARVDAANNVATREPYDAVVSLKTPDAYTVVVTLKAPYSPFVSQWFPLDGGPVLPAHLLENEPNLNKVAFNAAPVGTGPFVFDRWDRGRQIVYRANPSYFLGKPALDRVTVQLYADENTRDVALRTGETDWSFRVGTTSARHFVGDPVFATKLLATNAHFALSLQTRHAPFDDVRVRRAIAYAIDRKSLVAKISGDFALPATGDYPPPGWAYDPSVKAQPYDPAKARDLLAAAGFKPGANGMLERDGKPFAPTLVLAAGATSTEAYAVQIQAMLRAVGIDVNLKPMQANMLFAPAADGGALESGNFDLALSGFYNNADPDDRRVFGCADFPPQGFNVSFWCDRTFESAVDDALAHYDRATRRADYARASREVVDQVPVVLIYWPKDVQIVRPGVAIDDGAGNIAPPYRWHL